MRKNILVFRRQKLKNIWWLIFFCVGGGREKGVILSLLCLASLWLSLLCHSRKVNFNNYQVSKELFPISLPGFVK